MLNFHHRILFTLVLALATVIAKAQNIDFLDGNIKSIIIDLGYDLDGDGEISILEAEAIEYLDLNSKLLGDISDVNHFVNLKHLNLANNALGQSEFYKLDFNSLSRLEYLNVSSTHFDSLIIRESHSLDTLIAATWKYHYMDLSGLDSLSYLDCSSSKLSSLDIRYLTNLKFLRCSNTGITSFSNALPAQLEHFVCFGCEITDLGENFPKGIKTIFIKDANLNSLDLRDFKELQDVRLNENNIKVLNVEGLTKMVLLNAWDNQIEEINITGMDSLETFQVHENKLTSVDLSDKPNLNSVIISDNNLTALDVSQNPKLETLICADNPITSLDASFSDRLSYLYTQETSLTSLNTKNNSVENLVFSDIPTLEYICVDGFEFDYVDSLVNEYGYDQIVIDSMCLSNNVQILNGPKFKLSPNPVSDKLYLEYLQSAKELFITDLDGKELMHFKVNESQKNLTIDLHDLMPGTYFISVKDDANISTQKFIKQ